MMQITAQIQQKLNQLEPRLQQHLLEYIEFVIQKSQRPQPTNTFSFDWEGGLDDLKQKYTSVQLQHQAREWR